MEESYKSPNYVELLNESDPIQPI